MFSSRKAQSIIEYTVVILLVMVGLILMRPYVIRAINAHMKTWEDNVSDSMKDSLKEAQPPSPPVCPNGVCEIGEARETCCNDCHGSPACGDGTCCNSALGGTENPTN